MQGSALTSDVVRLVARAWRFADSEPDAALASARKAAETICLHVYIDTVAQNVGHIAFEEMIQKLTRAQTLPQRLAMPLKTVQSYGNFGVHSQTDDGPIDGQAVRTCLSALDEVVRWYFTTYLKQPIPPELSSLAVAPTRATPVPQEALPAAIRTRPVALVVGPRGVYVGSDDGEWVTVSSGNELGALPATGPFGAALIDPRGMLTVACWEPSVKQLHERAWSEIMLGAATLALAHTERGLVAGDADGGLTIVPTSSRIPVQDLSAGEPIVEIHATGDAVVTLGASGKVNVTAWPYRDGAPLVPIDTGAIGRAHGLYPGIRAGTAIVAGAQGHAVLGTRDNPAIVAVVSDAPAIRGVAPFRDRERAVVHADSGDAWIADASLSRVARLRLPGTVVVGATPTPDGTVLAWTGDGDLHVIAHDGAIRRVADRDIVLAAADPDRAGGYVAVHWNASDGARISRGRSAWT